MKQILLFFLSALSCLAQDIRTVGGHPVDLAPVRAWLMTHQGDRPMKHWKQVQITEFKGETATMPHVIITIDDGRMQEVLLKNIDAPVLAPLRELAEIDRQIAEVQPLANSQMASGGGSIVNQRMARMANNDIAAAQSRLSNLKQQRITAESKAKSAMQAKLLAMFVGTKYSGFEVWDCGRK
jgi:hypothetical protein